jgi:hypothetical protein
MFSCTFRRGHHNLSSTESDRKKEKESEAVWHSNNNGAAKADHTLQTGFSWSQKLSWLNRML